MADVKGDLSGLAVPGDPNDRITDRAGKVGQQWTPTGNPVELLTLGGKGTGTPVRATVTSFGPTLLSKVLGLNDTQESSLGLVFHFADEKGLALLDLKDLRSLLTHLTSPEGKAELAGLGGLSKATAGVILRQLVAFEDQGADVFFGEPEFDTADLLRTDADGRGIITCLELPGVQDRPALFSTFLMWLLADLFHDLPEESATYAIDAELAAVVGHEVVVRRDVPDQPLVLAEEPGTLAEVKGGFGRDIVHLAFEGPSTFLDRLVALGAKYDKAPEPGAPYVTVDGNLYTGQNPASSQELAERLVKDLS